MYTQLIYIIEVVICSGILAALYSLLLERRVSHIFARIYLVASVVVAAVIPLLKIPVYKADAIMSEVSITVGEMGSTLIGTTERGFDYSTLLWSIYGAGVAISVVALMMQLRAIVRIRQRGEECMVDGIRVVRSTDDIASFSFFNTIFIGANTPEEDLATIILHERSHILHRHSFERLVMEFFKSLLWWNPFVWIASRRLVEVEEFEADSDVISSGCDAKIYVTTLLKHLFGYSPEIANGIHNSLTKKRLKMILKNRSGRYALLRKAAVIPVMGTLLVLFSFTEREVVQSNTPSSSQVPVVESVAIDGYEQFHRWIMTNIIYPKEAKEQGLTGVVVVNFTVGEDGVVRDTKILRAEHQVLADEVLRVMAKAPAWNPVMNDGKAVAVKYALPVLFNADAQDVKTSNLPNEIQVVAY